MLRTETFSSKPTELRLFKPSWQDILRQEIAQRAEEIQPGRQGYRGRREIIDKVWRETLSVEQLGERRREVREFISSATSDSEKLLGRSYLGRIDYYLRKEICESGAFGKCAKELKGAAAVFAVTRGIKLENFDYHALARRMLPMMAQEPLEIDDLEVGLAQEVEEAEKRVKRRLEFHGISLPRLNSISIPEIKHKALVLAIPVIMALSGLGFLIANRVSRGAASPPVSEKPKTELIVPPVAPLAEEPQVVVPPTLPPTSDALESNSSSLISPEPTKEATRVAEKVFERLSLPVTGVSMEMKEAMERERLNVTVGKSITLSGEIFGNHSFEQKVVLPKMNGKFGVNELAIGAYSFDNKERTTIWAIHSGWVNGEVLPGQMLLENIDQVGKKMDISTGSKTVSAEYVGSFTLSKENYSFREESIVQEAWVNGYDLLAKKHLVVITCEKWNWETGIYDEVRVLLFLPTSSTTTAKTASR
ncbi:MAG: hypothetical protein ACOX50_03120 [Patescibacteria group bacterium]|jgi:hypothetical protein